MLTESQEKYLAGISEDSNADIKPWDSRVAEFARNLIAQLRRAAGLEIFWGGSLELGIPGQNDIDLTLFSEPRDFDKHVAGIVSVLGEPKYRLDEKILWRTTKDGYKIDARLGSKNSEEVRLDIFFTESLKNDPALLEEYKSLKEEGLSAREYYRRKSEFYNRVLTLRK